MNKYIIIISCIGIIAACGKEKTNSTSNLVKLNEGLVVNIPLNSSLAETVSGVLGTNTKGVFCPNRHAVPNQAIHFNRLDSAMVDFGDLSMASFTNSIFSISCWLLLEDTIKPCAVVSKRAAFGGFEYSIDNHFRNKQFFNLDNWNISGTNTVYGIDPLKASAPIQLNKWQHLVFIANGTDLKVYCDGILQTEVDTKNNESFANSDKPFVIGNGGGYGKNYYFQGAIDDVKIYNRVLNLEEIMELKNE